MAAEIKNGVGLMRYRRRWDIAPAGELAEVPGEILLNFDPRAAFIASQMESILPNLSPTGGDALYLPVKFFSFDTIVCS
jgi:hypothetical protein